MPKAPVYRLNLYGRHRNLVTDQHILNTFSLYYQNVGGLRTKIEDFYVKSSALDFDIIVFCETWLNGKIVKTFSIKLHNV